MESRPYFIRWLVFAILLTLFAAPRASGGGDSLYTVILSPRVGQIITRAERDHFRLFSSVERFQSARVLRTDSAHYRVVFTLADPEGAPRESLAVISPTKVFELSELIDQFEEIEESRYVFGSKAATIRVDGREIIRPPYVIGTQLPLGEPPGPRPAAMQWIFYIGAGASFHPGDFDGVEEMYSGIEARYEQRGYPVSGNPSSFSVGPRATYVLKVCPFPSLSFTAELSPPPSGGDFRVGFLSGFVDYAVPIDKMASLRWQNGLGLSRYSMKIMRRYGTRVSEIDTITGYYVLNSIAAEAHCLGLSAQTGILFVSHDDQVQFLIYGRYTWIPEQTATLIDGSVAALHLRVLQWGLRLQLAFY